MEEMFEKDKGQLPPPQDEAYWSALLRGQVLATTTHKFVTYVTLADQKAQAMIILNSILIPVTIAWAGKPIFGLAATLAIVTALISIFTAILCIYPKRRRGSKPDGTYNLLHFGDIGRMKEEQYLMLFRPIFNDLERLAEESVKDLHDVARRIIIPKFFWLKISYGAFFIGNMIAIALALYAFWSGY